MIDEITKFTNTFKDFVRPNRFKVIFVFPGIPHKWLDKLSLLVDTTSFPANPINNIQINRVGKKITIPFEETSPQLNITFLMDDEYTPLKTFERIYHFATKEDNTYISFDYFTETKIEIIQYNIDLSIPLFKYEFFRVIPTNLSDIALSHTSKQEIEKLTVTFNADTFNFIELG